MTDVRPRILTPAEYPAVRAAIDLSLDDRVLPDSVIALDIYQGAAEREVLVRDPLAAERTGEQLIRVKNAIVLFTAAFIAPRVPQIVSERLGDQSYNRQAADVAALVDDLRGRAEKEIGAILDPSAPVVLPIPTMFTLARGRRGQ